MIDIVKTKIEALDKEIQYCSERIGKAREAKALYEALIKEAELKSIADSTCTEAASTEDVRVLSYGE